jgi:hypothetical protein
MNMDSFFETVKLDPEIFKAKEVVMGSRVTTELSLEQ